MGRERLWTGLKAALLVFAGMAVAAAGQTQGLGALNKLSGGGQKDQQQQEVKAQELEQSLDNVIQVLENDKQRAELLAQLKSLRDSGAAASKEQSRVVAAGGLLESLAGLFRAEQDGDGTGGAVIGNLRQSTGEAFARVSALWKQSSDAQLWQALSEVGLGLALGVALLLLLMAVGRRVFRRRDWPLTLPPEPDARILVLHFLRRVLPWLITFAAMLAVLFWVDARTPARTTILVVAYVALCGRLLTTVFDVVISLFTRGHRRVAVAILHRKALAPLFVIGALVALGDAVNSERLEAMLGEALSDWVSVVANIVASLLSAWLVLRVRRPVKHMIRNRSYRRRHAVGVSQDMRQVMARFWHMPALLAITAVLVAILLGGSDTDTAFAKAVLCAVLLVLTLVGTGILRRYSEARSRRRDREEYRGKLERVGYALGHLVLWVLFVELSLMVWGLSVFGLGAAPAVGPVLGKALLGLALTLLAGWAAWIFADTAIYRALHHGSRRVNATRAQTIAPMLRNIAFTTILVITVIAALANLGVNVTPLLAGAGVVGLAVGFGAQSLVQDLISGVFILIEDSLAVGDFVEINGYMGSVEGLSLRTVRLRDLDGILHITTFSHISAIHNMSREFGIALMNIRIPHDLPIDDAINLMQETAEELRQHARVGSLIRSPLEMQGIHAFEDGCPILRMRFRTAPEYQWEVARTFNLLLKQRMEAQFVDLGVPRFSVSMEGQGGRQYRGSDNSGGADGGASNDVNTGSQRHEPGTGGDADVGQ